MDNNQLPAINTVVDTTVAVDMTNIHAMSKFIEQLDGEVDKWILDKDLVVSTIAHTINTVDDKKLAEQWVKHYKLMVENQQYLTQKNLHKMLTVTPSPYHKSGYSKTLCFVVTEIYNRIYSFFEMMQSRKQQEILQNKKKKLTNSLLAPKNKQAMTPTKIEQKAIRALKQPKDIHALAKKIDRCVSATYVIVRHLQEKELIVKFVQDDTVKFSVTKNGSKYL